MMASDAFGAIRDELFSLRDSERSASMSAYMRYQFRFFGVPSTPRRQVSMPVLRALKKETNVQKQELLQKCWAAEERELQYVAVDFVRLHTDAAKFQRDIVDESATARVQFLQRIESLIVEKSWWDTVDPLSKAYGACYRKAPAALHGEVLAVAEHSSLWMRRTAILHQLGFAEDTDVDVLAQCVSRNLGAGEFFIDKAIGWALRDCARTRPQWVRDFVEQHRSTLSPLSIREALKHVG